MKPERGRLVLTATVGWWGAEGGPWQRREQKRQPQDPHREGILFPLLPPRV